jgi:hypothetical protein
MKIWVMLSIAAMLMVAQRAVLPPPGPDPEPPPARQSAPATPRPARYPGSIIDAHLHAMTSAQLMRLGINTEWKWTASASADAHRAAVMKEMDRDRIVLGVVSGVPDALRPWLAAGGTRIIAGPMLFEPVSDPLPSIDMLRREYTAARWSVLGEINAQYAGVAPDDPRLEPYWTLAERLDVPVGFHTGTSTPGVPMTRAPPFQERLGNPMLLEKVLAKHPRLRVWLMDGGEPWRRETFALMAAHPQVYLDLAGIDWFGGAAGRPAFHDFLNEAIAHGLGGRIMFGSDELAWPQAIGEAIRRVDSAPFLTATQKRDIFYENAKRFFRLVEPPDLR